MRFYLFGESNLKETAMEEITENVNKYAPHSNSALEPPGNDLITTIIKANAKTSAMENFPT
jgi:hypothetical protein